MVPVEILISLYDVSLRIDFIKTVYEYIPTIASFLKITYSFVSFLRNPRILLLNYHYLKRVAETLTC